MTFALAVWVGDMDDPPERREAYKSGCLEITGLISLVMEPPDARYAFRISSKLKIDGQCVGEPVECVYAHWDEHAKRTGRNDSAVTYRAPQELKV